MLQVVGDDVLLDGIKVAVIDPNIATSLRMRFIDGICGKHAHPSYNKNVR